MSGRCGAGVGGGAEKAATNGATLTSSSLFSERILAATTADKTIKDCVAMHAARRPAGLARVSGALSAAICKRKRSVSCAPAVGPEMHHGSEWFL